VASGCRRPPAGPAHLDLVTLPAFARWRLRATVIGGPLHHVLDEVLVSAARAQTGIVSDTEPAEVALVSLVLEDDFGAWLLEQGGRLDPDLDLEF
jgi:hypothetical protein